MGKKVRDVFWRKDGYSAQDHAFLLFTTPFALMWIVASIMALFGIPIDPTFMDLLEIMQTPMMVIIAGLFSVSAVSTFKRPNGNESNVSIGNPNAESRVEMNYDKKNDDYNNYDDRL